MTTIVTDVNQHSKLQPQLPTPLVSHENKENQNLITVMKEAKSQTISTTPNMKSNELALKPNEIHHENPYIYSIMKEMLAKKDTNNTSEPTNLTAIVKDVGIHEEKQKKLRPSQELPNANLLQIMKDIFKHESQQGSEPSSNLINIAADIKMKEFQAIRTHNGSIMPKNPRQKASQLTNGEFTTSAIDIYAQDEKTIDPSQAMADVEMKNRAFSRLSSPDVSDETARLKYGVKSFSTRPNETQESMSVPVGIKQNFGVVRVTAHYDELRSRLSITVHEAKYSQIYKLFLFTNFTNSIFLFKRNLRIVDKRITSDAYVRVFLIPDERPSFKRKTQIIKNNQNPYWQDTFDYRIDLNRALNKTLIVNLKNHAGKNQDQKYLGEVCIYFCLYARVEVKIK